MRILFLDTETNGLPKNRYAPYTYPGAWPSIVQIAWQIWDFEHNEIPVLLQSTSTLIKPEKDVVWDKESEAIHKITREKAEGGMDPKQILMMLITDAKTSDLAIIHNLAFDKPVVWAFSHRFGEDPVHWWPKRDLCSMLETVNLCKIPSTSKFATEKDPYKWPKLEELYKTLFPTRPTLSNLHDARGDVDCLVQCVEELQRRRLIVPDLPAKPDRFTTLFRKVLRDLGTLRM